MRHLAWLLVLGLGCGRIGIDPLATTDGQARDASPDAAPVPCAVEGSPCDDGNICTATSMCTAGICVPDGDTTCTVARSEAEFSTTQGDSGWFYGYWEVSTDPNGTYEPATDYLPFALFSGGIWRPPTYAPEPDPNFNWAYLMAWGGHPASFPELRVSIRRWVSDVSGRAGAVVHMAAADTGGDGTRAILVVDGVTLFSRDLDGSDTVGFTETVPIDVVVGSTVDLLLHPNVLDSVDTTTMSMDIESR